MDIRSMNKLRGKIESVEVSGNLSIVSLLIGKGTKLKSIVIETPETAAYLKTGIEISALFKETEVIIGTGDQLNVSIQNKIQGAIISIEKGNLLSEIIVDIEGGEITAIISTSAAEELGLQSKMVVTTMIKMNEIMLSER